MNAVRGKLRASLHFFRLVVFTIVITCTVVNSARSQDAPDRIGANQQSDGDQFHRSWRVGGFFTGGFPPNYEIHVGEIHHRQELQLYNAGFEGGKMLTAVHGSTFLRGRVEAAVEVIPFWLAYSPKQEDVVYDPINEYTSIGGFPSYSVHGISVTPLLFRWNFMKRDSSRIVPWVQLGSGLLWTARPFPQGEGPGYYTSRINFTPQVGVGQNIFTKKNQSLNMAVKAVHISSAGLGEYNPGVIVSLQFSLGYSWWK
jgi:lipid A 3-O-deacylase